MAIDIGTGILAKLAADILPASVGALMSMQFLPTDLTRMQKGTALVSAWAVGTYFGRGLAAYLNITNPHISDAIIFGFALFGLSFVGTAMSEMKPILRAFVNRWIGPTPDVKDDKQPFGDVK